jgi:hypothetical protein
MKCSIFKNFDDDYVEITNERKNKNKYGAITNKKKTEILFRRRCASKS